MQHDIGGVEHDLRGDRGRLVLNARSYRYDPTLDPIADLIEQGPAAWSNVHPHLLDLGAIHKDFRDSYRAAVKAGAIPDDRNESTWKESQI